MAWLNSSHDHCLTSARNGSIERGDSMFCPTSKMSHDYGWRGSCAAGDVTDVVVGSSALLGRFFIRRIYQRKVYPHIASRHSLPLGEAANHSLSFQPKYKRPLENLRSFRSPTHSLRRCRATTASPSLLRPPPRGP